MKKRIMIIDDDLELLSILHDLFVNEGFEVIVYPDKNSIKGVIIGKPDIVLLDNKLRDGFGYELCAHIKANDMTKKVPVIMTSAYHDLSELASGCGADGYIEKPFNLDALVALVKQHLAATDTNPSENKFNNEQTGNADDQSEVTESEQNPDQVTNIDDLHEIQVNDDLNEPDPEKISPLPDAETNVLPEAKENDAEQSITG